MGNGKGVIVVAVNEMDASACGGAPDPGHGVDVSRLRPEVAAPVSAFLAAVDALVALAGLAGPAGQAGLPRPGAEESARLGADGSALPGIDGPQTGASGMPGRVDLDGAEAAAVAAVIAHGTSRLGVVQARMLPVVEADGLWSLTAPSLKTWAARELRVGVRAADAQVPLGRELRDHLPLTAAAAAAGEITVDHAQILARFATTTERRVAELADPDSLTNEAFLVDQARIMPVDQFRGLLRRWAAAADPDADDRGYSDACERQYVTLDRLPDGYHLSGFLTVDNGQVLVTALGAVTPVPPAGDPRSSGQRRAQALGDLGRVVLAHGLAGAGRATRPRINVHVSFGALQDAVDRAQAAEDASTLPGITPELAPLTREAVLNGPQYEDGTPIPRVLLDRLACDSELSRYIFGPTSQVLDVGRAERTFTNARRDAIIARDRHCQYPGCTAPPGISECHHVKHWARDGGSTSVANGILLCSYHHDVVHRRRIEIHRRRIRWVFTDASGQEISDEREVKDERAISDAQIADGQITDAEVTDGQITDRIEITGPPPEDDDRAA